jgi:hypothetical protein
MFATQQTLHFHLLFQKNSQQSDYFEGIRCMKEDKFKEEKILVL